MIKQMTAYMQLRRLAQEPELEQLSERERTVLLRLIEVGLREGVEVDGQRVLAYEWQRLIRKVAES